MNTASYPPLFDLADAGVGAVPPTARPRLLSEADCQDITRRIVRAAQGGGATTVTIWSCWTGNIRWARNRLTTTGEIRNDYIRIFRNINGATSPWVLINDSSDAALVAAARRAERLLMMYRPEDDAQSDLLARLQNEPAASGVLFSEATYQLDADHRAAVALQLVRTSATAGMLSAGYVEVGAHSMAMIDTLGHTRYCPYTTARMSITVRDPKGTGSGWAGIDWPDWSRIDGAKLTATAMEKCLASRNPVPIEPGRYTTILEPQAVCDFIGPMFHGTYDAGNSILSLSLPNSPRGFRPNQGAFSDSPPTWKQKKGQQVIDSRITISVDPTNPDLAFPPFNFLQGIDVEWWNPQRYATYHPVIWIEHGVLKNMYYDREFAIDKFGENTGMPQCGAFSMSGGETSPEEMIATTKRGLLVTRLYGVRQLNELSELYRGYTRDGLWLIENGKISKPVENLVFTESILFALNNIDQLGVPQSTFHPSAGRSLREIPQPVIVPPMKVRDFSFTSMTAAV